MPGLLRGVARTAVVAGTATAVSGRVQRRQADKYAERDAQPPRSAPRRTSRRWAPSSRSTLRRPSPIRGPPQQQYAPPPEPQYAPEPEAPLSQEDLISQLKQLGELRDAGILTEDEFAAQKAKLLG